MGKLEAKMNELKTEKDLLNAKIQELEKELVVNAIKIELMDELMAPDTPAAKVVPPPPPPADGSPAVPPGELPQNK